VTSLDERLRERLAAAAPDFDPVTLGDVAEGVRRRRRAAGTAAIAGVAILAAAALAVPALVLRDTAPGAGPAAAGGTATGATTPATPTGDRSTASDRPCPPSQHAGGGSYTIVDYVDFIQVGGRTYVASPISTVGPGALGAALGTVHCGLSDIRPDPAYRARDWDAGLLPARTPVFSVAGYPATFRLAVPDGGHYRLYEVDTAPDARTGADLLAVRGRVDAVEVRAGDHAERVLGRLADPARVRALVDGVLRAPVEQDVATEPAPLSVRLVLTDGTAVERLWFRREGVLERGILLPTDATRILDSLAAG
jgi:hypothetical protein